MTKNESKELPLLESVPNDQCSDHYEDENSWLIDILTIAARNYGFNNSLVYEQKISLLKGNPLCGLSRGDLFWIADKFARHFSRAKYRYDYYFYHTQFFTVFFGLEKKTNLNTLFWTDLTYKRLEKKALERPNPSQSTFFRSGASSKSDFLGYCLAKKPVGVQIHLCSQAVKDLILEYNAKGGRVFVDTGSFSTFTKGVEVDFDKVFREYFSLVKKAQNPELLTLVGVDVIGQQAATLELLSKYKEKIYKLICMGADVIVPIQLGTLSLAEAYKQTVSILQTTAFRPGIPSNRKSASLEQILEFVSTIQPKNLHCLGLASNKFQDLIDKIKTISPDTHLSGDATTLRAKLKKGSKVVLAIEKTTKQAVEKALFVGSNGIDSYQSLINSIFHNPGFLSKSQAKLLAKLITPLKREQERIVFAALNGLRGMDNGSRLGDLLESSYDKATVEQALKQFSEIITKPLVSGNIRANIIAEIETRCA